jgi:hypothetical protein
MHLKTLAIAKGSKFMRMSRGFSQMDEASTMD